MGLAPSGSQPYDLGTHGVRTAGFAPPDTRLKLEPLLVTPCNILQRRV